LFNISVPGVVSVTEIGSIKLEINCDADSNLPVLERIFKDSLARHKYQRIAIPGKVSIKRTLVEMSTVRENGSIANAYW
jgi:hypothetical protein